MPRTYCEKPCDCAECKALHSIFNGITSYVYKDLCHGKLIKFNHRSSGNDDFSFIAYEPEETMSGIIMG